MTIALGLAAGLLVGALLGALGGGGSIVAVPVLVYALGQNAHQATTGSLLVVGLGALFGLLPHVRAGHVRVRQGVVFGLTGIAGSFLGTASSRSLDPDALMSLFAVLLLVVAASMVAKSRRSAQPSGSLPRRRPAAAVVLRVVAAATTVGFLTGFFGVGGGFAVVPALVLALGFSMPTAVGTSLLVIVLNSGSALVFHRLGPSPDWAVVLPFAAATIAGSLLGARLAPRLPARALTLGFAVFLVLVAVYTGLRSVSAVL